VNAAFLLVTAAWLGADAPPPPAHPVPPPAPVVAGDCNNNCNNDCGCGGHHGWSSRFHGHKCGCESKTDSCGSGCGGGFLEKCKGRFHRGGDCGCDSGCGHTAHHEHGCNDCGGGCGGGFFEKCKARFHRGGDCGCDNGCGGATGYGPGGPAHAEPIPAPKPGDAPKKMPDAPKSVQILTPQAPAGSTLVIEQ